MPQALKTKGHTPKVVRINGDDNMTLIYRNLGNGRRVPFLIGTSVTVASGSTTADILSGAEFHGYKISDAVVQVTPTNEIAAGRYWIEKDSATPKLVLHHTNTISDTNATYDVYVFLGDAASSTLYDSSSSNQIWKR
jgi:hypothetical protein